jgi:hypothetical protein
MVGTRQFDQNALLEAAVEMFWQNRFGATSVIADQPKVATLSSGAWLRSRFE